MRKVVVSEYLSLDGIMEDPGGAEGFEHGGWTVPYFNDELEKFQYEGLFGSDALLLGRVTYQGFAAAWPSMTDEQGFADRMNGLPKYVVSATLEKLEWNNSHLLKGDIAKEVAKLKQQPGQDIMVAGSARLIQMLMQYKLIDEFRLMVHPVILGSGKRLFENGKTSLSLVDTKRLSSGVVILTYQLAEG